MRINTRIDFNLYLNKEKGEEVVFYPYMTTRFTTSPLIEMDRYGYDVSSFEQELCELATKKYDGWGTRKYISTNGVKQDNKCTFTLKGMAYHFHDSELWIYPESVMEVGRF